MKTSKFESYPPLILVIKPRLKTRAHNGGTVFKLEIKSRGHSNGSGKVICSCRWVECSWVCGESVVSPQWIQSRALAEAVKT